MRLPAAATTTTLRSKAYFTAAPRAASSGVAPAAEQATSEMLMTVAPMSTARTTAPARVSTLPCRPG
ncbi:Uncharacterised protein [Mycobacteroides abscessus subsp. abscessus]|nr:Uncharacterised protein [Mycobacteroides abscessus subsp. abscessus]